MEELVKLANAYVVSSMHKVWFYILISLYLILSLQIPKSKNRHDMCTKPKCVCMHNIVLQVSCGKSVSDCLSVCVVKYVLHMGAIYSALCVCLFVCLCCLYCFIVCFVFKDTISFTGVK